MDSVCGFFMMLLYGKVFLPNNIIETFYCLSRHVGHGGGVSDYLAPLVIMLRHLFHDHDVVAKLRLRQCETSDMIHDSLVVVGVKDNSYKYKF